MTQDIPRSALIDLIGVDTGSPASQFQRQTFAVVRALYEVADQSDLRLDVLQLEKLAYIAHGWSLALTERTLINEPFTVRPYGPVLASLADLRRHYGTEGLPRRSAGRLFAHPGRPLAVARDAEALIATVVRDYAPFPAWKLSALTRLEGGAHARAFGLGDTQIENAEIRADFLRLIDTARAAIAVPATGASR